MKKYFALMLALVLVLSAFVGCGAKAEEAPAEVEAEATVEEVAEDVALTLADFDYDAKIGITVKNQSALFYTSIINGCQTAIDEINAEYGTNHELIVCDDAGELATELANVENLINMGVDLMIFVAMDPKSSVPAYELCLEQEDMVTVIVDAPCDGSEKCDLVIVSDNYEAGRLEMEMLCEAIGGEGNIVMISDSTNPNAAIRESGAQDELKNWPNVNLLEVRDIKSSVENALTAMQDMLNVYVDEGIDGVWTFSDTPAQGAVSAVESAGLHGEVIVTGIDGNATAKQLIKDGTQFGSAAQFPNMLGYEGVYQGLDIVLGNTPEEQTVYVPVAWIGAENVDEYIDTDQ